MILVAESRANWAWPILSLDAITETLTFFSLILVMVTKSQTTKATK